MTANSNGAVVLDDGGCPRTFTASAREVISGGVFVFISGAAGLLSSGASSFAYGDVQVAANASGATCAGIAMHNAASGATVTIATRGRFIVASESTINDASILVDVAGANAVCTSAAYTAVVGRTLAAVASGGFTILDLNL